jgi:anti-sigma factor RsiW
MAPDLRSSHDGPVPSGAHVRDLLDTYVDDELPPARALAVADHLTACAECSAAYDAMLVTVATLREALVYYQAPDTLRSRVRAALRDTARRDASTPAPSDDAIDAIDEKGPVMPPPPTTESIPAVRRGVRRATWAWGAAAALALVTLSSGATLLASGARQASERVEQQVLASHLRSLMPEHLTDVRSNDQHNVKPWFNGRLDFSPTVPRLESQGFPLLGGRVDYVADRPVAVVVYGRRQHVINVYSWPTSEGHAGMSHATSHGYHTLRWRDAGVEHWVVSDLNAAELAQLATLLQQAPR